MSKPIKESVLLKSSTANDVQCSGGVISITGLKPLSLKNITAIKQVNYRAEVAQVVTVAGTTYTPTSNTTYSVVVTDPLRVQAGYQESQKKYSHTTGTVTGVAATDRENISLALVAKINADATNHAVAATLTGGAGFTVTDDGGYYPVWSQGMTNVKGINQVYTVTNPDGTGYASDNFSVTTAGVYSFGVGANLLAEKPVVDYVYGNLISGVIMAPPVTATNPPQGAVSGQKYDGFVIESLKEADAIGVTGQYAYVERVSYIFVDNGAGGATTNTTGFKATEREMHKLMASLYKDDTSAVIEFFDRPIAFQDPLGAAPTGTADTLGWQISPYTSLNRTNIGTQTIVAPVLDATGLLLDQDDTAGDGSHTSSSQQTVGGQQFIVGKTAFMVMARVVAADWTDTQFMVGFRLKAAYAADYNNYTDLAAIGGAAADGDSVTTQGILNNAATVATDTTVNFVDGASALLVVKVALNGAVTCQVNGATYPVYSAGTTPLVFDAGDVMIPFYQHVNIGSGNPAVSISEFVAVATDSLIS
jgi:hypothetical protein